jgi:hypothetical protein
MPTSHASQLPAATSASRSIRSFLHLQNGKGTTSATLLPPASVNRLTDEFLRAVNGAGSTHQTGAKSGIGGSLDEDVVAKMLSEGARSHDVHSQKMSLVTTSSNLSSPRIRKVQKSSGSISPKSPRSSERRMRAAAASTAPPPMPPAAASIVETFGQMQKLKPKPDTHQPQNQNQPVLQYREESCKEVASAVAPLSSQVQSFLASKPEDAGSTKVRQDISVDGALSVLAGLAEIREVKAGSLERSLERESVRVHALGGTAILSARFTLSGRRCSSAILRILKQSSHVYMYVVFKTVCNFVCTCKSLEHVSRCTHSQTGTIGLSYCSF